MSIALFRRYQKSRSAVPNSRPVRVVTDFIADDAMLPRIGALRKQGNAEWQRDLAISNERIGDLYAQQGDNASSRKAFENALQAYEVLTKRNPDDVQSQLFSVVPLWRLSKLDPARKADYLQSALSILKPLEKSNQLDARRVKWIGQMEDELRKL